MNGGATQLHDRAPEPDIEAAQRHFETFEKLAEGQGGWFVLCGITEDPVTGKEEITSRPIENKHTNTGSPSTRLLNAALALADDGPSNIYLSPCLLASKPQGRSRGNQSDVMRALAFPQDFDGGKGGDHLKQCPIAPHYVVQSSTGNIQAWWIPDAPVKKGDAAKIMAALTRACSQDAEKADRPDHCSATLHQIMRVPGFVNWPNAKKRKAGRVPELATVTHPYEGGSIRVKDLAALDDRYPDSPARATNGTSPAEWTTGPVSGAAPIADDTALIERALASTSARATFGGGASFRDLWEANSEALASAFPAAGGYDASRADSALATQLAWWTGKDCERIERLMRQSGLVREKWQRGGAGASNYLRHTILGAVAIGDSVYTGKAGDTDEVPDEIEALNQEYAVVLEQGEALIYREREHRGRRWFDVLTFEAFKKWHRNQHVTINTGDNQTKRRALGDYWIDHPMRRQYSDVVFRPDGDAPPGALNLWRGFGVEPQAGDWSAMRRHIREVVCDSDPALYRYVIGWLARLVQEPGSPGEVALVMRGGQGTGKGMFARWVHQLLGQHGLHVGSPEHLVGQFNGHLRDAAFVFCDEAFFAGDPKHKNKLKALITEPRITIEQKFRQAVQVDNVLHLIMASNADWVVPAELDERRFVLLDVPGHRRNDFAYFTAIEEQMANGGASAMLHDLLSEDLTGFNVRALPHTSGLVDQKIRSLQGPQRWLADRLHAGSIGGTEWGARGLEIDKDAAYSHYERWSESKRSRDYQTADRATWSRKVREMLPGVLHEFRPAGGPRRRRWRLSPLDETRDAFAGVLGGPVRWDDTDDANEKTAGGDHEIFS